MKLSELYTDPLGPLIITAVQLMVEHDLEEGLASNGVGAILNLGKAAYKGLDNKLQSVKDSNTPWRTGAKAFGLDTLGKAALQAAAANAGASNRGVLNSKLNSQQLTDELTKALKRLPTAERLAAIQKLISGLKKLQKQTP